MEGIAEREVRERVEHSFVFQEMGEGRRVREDMEGWPCRIRRARRDSLGVAVDRRSDGQGSVGKGLCRAEPDGQGGEMEARGIC